MGKGRTLTFFDILSVAGIIVIALPDRGPRLRLSAVQFSLLAAAR